MTIENFDDFLIYKKINEIEVLKGQTISYNNLLLTIDQIMIDQNLEVFTIKNTNYNINIKCQFSQIENIKSLIVEK